MWLQKIDENGWGGDKLYKHKIQPLKNITDITRCIESWTLPNVCNVDREDMIESAMYFDGKRMYYPKGREFVCGDNNGKYSVWSNEKYGYIDFSNDALLNYSIIGPWLHFVNCDISAGEDAVDVFIPNEVELAEKDKWLIIRK
jgi:hypothetical protein